MILILLINEFLLYSDTVPDILMEKIYAYCLIHTYRTISQSPKYFWSNHQVLGTISGLRDAAVNMKKVYGLLVSITAKRYTDKTCFINMMTEQIIKEGTELLAN